MNYLISWKTLAMLLNRNMGRVGLMFMRNLTQHYTFPFVIRLNKLTSGILVRHRFGIFLNHILIW